MAGKAFKKTPQGDAGNSMTTDQAIARISIKPIKWNKAEIRLRGESPYIPHKWSQKAIIEMQATQARKIKGPKQPRDIEYEYANSPYYLDDGKTVGIPANAFKQAMVGACRFQESLKMTSARGLFFVRGIWSSDAGRELVPIKFQKAKRRVDPVRLSGGGSADLRYRYEYQSWEATLSIEYNADFLGPTELVYLLQFAGCSIGVGEMRPEQNGDVFGRFEPNLPTAKAMKKAA